MMSPGEKMVWAAAYVDWFGSGHTVNDAAGVAAVRVHSLRAARERIEADADDLTRRLYLEMIGTELDSPQADPND